MPTVQPILGWPPPPPQKPARVQIYEVADKARLNFKLLLTDDRSPRTKQMRNVTTGLLKDPQLAFAIWTVMIKARSSSQSVYVQGFWSYMDNLQQYQYKRQKKRLNTEKCTSTRHVHAKALCGYNFVVHVHRTRKMCQENSAWERSCHRFEHKSTAEQHEDAWPLGNWPNAFTSRSRGAHGFTT